ncbi:MAG TPA: YicC/YloC family endoribonuclease [Vicinamibacterales bacterium]
MIKSMTGFASLTHDAGSAAVGVTIRAVNHRFLDLQLRLPSALADREPRIRALVQQSIARGRVELAVSVQSRVVPVPQVELNEPYIAALESALEHARTRGIITGHLTPGDLVRLPHAIVVRDAPPDDDAGEALGAQVDRAIEEALAALERMRVHEGEHLRQDLEARRLGLADLIEQIAAAAAAGADGLRERLAARVEELTADLAVDRAAIAQEIVRVVGRSDISEEVTRFRAHLVHWTSLVEAPEPCGRKLDFLLQEMNREINTIGAKADGSAVSALVVAAKAELEKMREQVQNVE